MPVQKLTDGFARTVKLPDGVADVTFWDPVLRGFGLRLRRETGGTVNKAWIVWYRIKDQKQQRKTRLGPAGMDAMPAKLAREIANDLLAKARLGTDQVGDRKKAAAAPKPHELGPAFERYLKQAEGRLRPNTLREVQRHLRRDWAPIQHIAANALTRVEINARLSEITAEHGPVAANRSRASLSAFLAWCIREGLAESNPVIAARRPEPERARERTLTRDEIAAIWKASGDGAYGRILKLLLLLGQRRSEVGGIAAEEIDLERRVWILPARRAKNHRENVLPLSNPAITILRAALAEKPEGYLFGRRGFQAWSDSRAALNKRLPPTMKGFVIHDVRRSVATGLADIAVPPHIIEAILNHQSGAKRGVAGTYNRSEYANEKRQALDMWAAHVEALVTGQAGANIVAMPARTAGL